MERFWSRALVSLLLGASGVLTLAGARERWWPACRPGAFDSRACLLVQDDRYDPTRAVEQLASLSYAALAVPVALLPWLLGMRPRLAVASGALLGGTLALVAAGTWSPELPAERLVEPLLAVAVASWVLLSPLAVVLVVGTSALAPDPELVPRSQPVARGVLAAVLCLATPVPQYLLAPLVVAYSSHDTTPWTGAAGGVLLLVAALVVWPATGGRAPAHDRERAARVVRAG
ncbi:hypothetical protein [Nocardioides sp. zg-DK7169]|uniref:hypothetical protein n=1 Tax=Nocardioides sp. zg-DK7169 TaxID=2736600 RepID=UPI0015524DC4|nr:hypothetical protein [Nocardioides sp. zg-DK7169]NPC97813.1 hypothetical protein [Nocardioides sp. zg-DK7169]